MPVSIETGFEDGITGVSQNAPEAAFRFETGKERPLANFSSVEDLDRRIPTDVEITA